MRKTSLIILLILFGLAQTATAMTSVIANFEADPTNGSVPLQVQFTDLSSSGVKTWSWNFGDGTDTLKLQNPTHIFQEPGTYSVQLYIRGLCDLNDEYRGGACLNESTISHNIIVNGPPPPKADFIATPSSGSIPLTVQFTDTSENDPVEWEWDFGDRGYSTLQNPSHTYTKFCNIGNNQGTIPVRLFVRSRYHKSSSYESNIILKAPPDPISSFTVSPTSGPAPLSVQFSDTSDNMPSAWKWDFDDGTTSDLQNPSHTYKISGVYTVTMQASIDTTCNPVNPASSIIYVLSPQAPSTNHRLSESNPTTLQKEIEIPSTETTLPTTESIISSTTLIENPTPQKTQQFKNITNTPYIPPSETSQATPLGFITVLFSILIGLILLIREKKI